jgi:hypothetical protein
MSGWTLAALILSTIGLTLGISGLIHTIVNGDFNDK